MRVRNTSLSKEFFSLGIQILSLILEIYCSFCLHGLASAQVCECVCIHVCACVLMRVCACVRERRRKREQRSPIKTNLLAVNKFILSPVPSYSCTTAFVSPAEFPRTRLTSENV